MAIRSSVDFKISGHKEVGRKLQDYAERFPAAAAGALQEQMNQGLEQDVYDSTPEKTGNLRNTIRTTEPVIQGKRISCSIEAGGPDAPYALIVHEDLDAFHPVGDAKYIERPFNRAARTFGPELGTRLQVNKVL